MIVQLPQTIAVLIDKFGSIVAHSFSKNNMFNHYIGMIQGFIQMMKKEKHLNAINVTNKQTEKNITLRYLFTNITTLIYLWLHKCSRSSHNTEQKH
jgi:hypothetical protein